MLHQPFRGDLRGQPISLVDALPAGVAQRKGKRLRHVGRVGRGQLVVFVHGPFPRFGGGTVWGK